MEATEVLDRLKPFGFINTGKIGLGGHHRITHPRISKGSLYVGNQYISGTGEYAEIKKVIPQSSFDHKGYPEWRNSDMEIFLCYLRTWMSKDAINGE